MHCTRWSSSRAIGSCQIRYGPGPGGMLYVITYVIRMLAWKSYKRIQVYTGRGGRVLLDSCLRILNGWPPIFLPHFRVRRMYRSASILHIWMTQSYTHRTLSQSSNPWFVPTFTALAFTRETHLTKERNLLSKSPTLIAGITVDRPMSYKIP